MNEPVIQLYPLPAKEIALEGLYLDHDIRERAATSDAPYIYANFITSLDGRTATEHPKRSGLVVPKETSNPRDWRLFQELVAQADIIISSGRYLRDWADGRAQEILRVDDPRFSDLREWRQNRGLKPLPDIAVISRSLRFPLPEVLTAGGREAIVFTVSEADPERMKKIEDMGCRLFIAGKDSVGGRELTEQMVRLGYRIVYSAAGPKILHLLLEAGVLNRLYLTYANRVLGGQMFSTIVDGPSFEPAVGMALTSLYYDVSGLDGLGQLFAVYSQSAPG